MENSEIANAKDRYERINYLIPNENLKHIIKRIILDERLHIEIFTKLLEQTK